MIVYPTNTELDHHITAEGETIGGFPSGCIVALVQMQESVGATSLCESPVGDTTTSVFWNLSLCGDLAWLLDIMEHAVKNRGANYVVFDSLLELRSDRPSLDLVRWLPGYAALAAEHDALIVFVTQEHHDPNTGDTYFTGEKAFKQHAEYIILLDRTSDDEHAKYIASCIWSPAGCRFSNVEWTLPKEDECR